MKRKTLLALSLLFPLGASADKCPMVKFDAGAGAVEMIREEQQELQAPLILYDTLHNEYIPTTHVSLVRIQNPLSSIALFEIHVETPGNLETKVVDIGYLEMIKSEKKINIGDSVNCLELEQ